MQATAQTFAEMTQKIKDTAQTLCDGKLVLVHEGGYAEVYVPFCGHAAIQTLAGSSITAPDPAARAFDLRQPNATFDRFLRDYIDGMAKTLDL